MNVACRVRIGLTVNQAKAYLSLVQSGPLSAKDLSTISDIARPDVYRVIAALQENGIVEKRITNPAIYRAIPMEQGISMMLKRMLAEQKDLVEKAEYLITETSTNNGNNSATTIESEDNRFVLVPGKEDIIRRLMDALDKVQISLDTLTSQKRFSSAILAFAKGYQRALDRGVRIRIATEKQIVDEEALNVLRELQKSGSFEVNYYNGSPQAIVAIFDGKEAYSTLSATANLTDALGIWSNNTCFIALAQNYFDTKWNNSA